MSMKPTAPDPATASTASAGGGFSLKPSKQTVLILAVLIGVVLAGSAGFASWQYSQKQERDAIIANKTQQVNDSTMVAKQLTAKEAEFASLQARIGRLESSVSESDYVPTLMKQLESLAKSNSLRIMSQSQSFEAAPEPPTDKEARKNFVVQPYDKEIIRLSIKGHYSDIQRFLFRLTEFPKILSVDSLDLKPDTPVPGESPVLTVSVDMTGYLFKPDDVAAPTTTTEGSPGLSLPQMPEPKPMKRREI